MIRPIPVQGRRGRRVAATLAGLAMLVSLSAATAERAEAKVPREFFGVVPTITPDAADYPRMKQMGVGTMRGLMSWPVLEPSPGTYDWTYFDQWVARAAAAGDPPLSDDLRDPVLGELLRRPRQLRRRAARRARPRA